MKKFSRVLALLMCLALMLSVAVISAQAADEDVADVAAEADVADLSAGVDAAQTGADSIIIHIKSTDKVPYIYYWNALPTNKETSYPGVKMSLDPTQGSNWYTYTFTNTSKINLLFTDGTSNLSGQLSKELTRNAGEWWYMNGRFRSKNPEEADDYTCVDMRQDSIYFVITTRFFDGDTGNNVHCWADAQANNPDSDPAWRGDFKGLADKLDYIKALGFSAIWITPVAANASGYDYHGYHAINFKMVDPRYESDDFTYDDLIAAAHEKDIKIIQDVVWNHTGNFGEENLEPIFTRDWDADQANVKECMVPTKKLLDYCGVSTPEEYYALPDQTQYDKRLQVMKQTKGFTDYVSTDPVCNANNYYHNGYFGDGMNWDDYTCKFHQIAGDCVDLNTENKAVADYTVEAYSEYIDRGVDGFRVDTVRHIPRLTLNKWYNDRINAAAKANGNNNFRMFGEVCCRYNQIWYRDNASESVQFYTWDDSAADLNKLSEKTDPASIKQNIDNAITFCKNHISCDGQPTSNNAFLNGINYRTPDYSKNSGMGVIDFTMHWNFDEARNAYGSALAQDQYNNDATYNVTYVDSHDYSPDNEQKVRFNKGTNVWAENLCLMFTFRGIPCIFYGSEIEFQKGQIIDEGPNRPLSTTGRAYFGDNIEGSVNTTGFSQYSNATGKMATTLNSTLSKHIQKLNAIRRAVPALQLGQYTTNSNYVSGGMSFIRRYQGPYTDHNGTTKTVDSLACVSVTDGATFKNIPNGTYVDAVTGTKKTVSNGTLSVESTGKGNMRVYVLQNSSSTVTGAVGPSGQTYLK